MATPATGKIVFEKDGVLVQSCCGRIDSLDNLISGTLRVFEKDADVIVEWRPLEDNFDANNIPCAGKDSSSVVEWMQTSKERAIHSTEHQNSYEAEWDMVNTVSFKKKHHANGDSSCLLNSQSKCSFRFSLADLALIKKIKEDNLLTSVVFCLKDDAILPTLQLPHDIIMLFNKCLEKYVLLCKSGKDRRILLVKHPNKSPTHSFENLIDEPTFGVIDDLKKDPYTATMVGFSKVTNYIFDTLRGSDPAIQHRPPQEMADFFSDTIPQLKMNQQEEPGFEVITQIDVGHRLNVRRREPVSQAEWVNSMDAEGRILNVDHMKQIIFKGGVCHALRKEVWKFLLNYFSWNSTKEERLKLQKAKTDEYFRMKLQWKSVSVGQQDRNSRFRDYKSLIEKDVNRTDRTNTFYEGQDNPSLILLHDILMTYCMYDFDLGYVQGMSDLLSPILYVMENEVDAFWCFVSYMDQMHQNFEEQMQGLKIQLIQLSALLRLLDSGFCSYLESQDSGYLYFCFRWLLIRFKREFSFKDILRMWEVMWTGLPCKNFHLLICCAILESEKPQIMDHNFGFNEILKHINELSMKLDVDDVLCKAEAICLQMMKCKELPQTVCEVLAVNNHHNTTTDLDASAKESTIERSSHNSAYQNDTVSQISHNGTGSDPAALKTTNSINEHAMYGN
ncbi:TBC1 domain family member 15 isoform X2 [Ambystoma mexicanum]|uniref:TBC1 domain family member 15 isoform X2 n=1 Tax=Ambystoma mexicanum TaxID=8296 RepID=UPI0037E9B907